MMTRASLCQQTQQAHPETADKTATTSNRSPVDQHRHQQQVSWKIISLLWPRISKLMRLSHAVPFHKVHVRWKALERWGDCVCINAFYFISIWLSRKFTSCRTTLWSNTQPDWTEVALAKSMRWWKQKVQQSKWNLLQVKASSLSLTCLRRCFHTWYTIIKKHFYLCKHH